MSILQRRTLAHIVVSFSFYLERLEDWMATHYPHFHRLTCSSASPPPTSTDVYSSITAPCTRRKFFFYIEYWMAPDLTMVHTSIDSLSLYSTHPQRITSSRLRHDQVTISSRQIFFLVTFVFIGGKARAFQLI